MNNRALKEVLEGMLGVMKRGLYAEDVSGRIATMESMVEFMDEDGEQDEQASVEQDGRTLFVKGVEQAGIVVQSGKTIILNSCGA